MPTNRNAPLRDLHCHLFGCLAPEELEFLALNQAIDWSAYEHAWEAAYGSPAGIRRIISDLRSADTGIRDTARQALLGLSHFTRGQGFARFQATANLNACLLAWTRSDAVRCHQQFDRLVPAIIDRHRRAGLAGVQYRVLVPTSMPLPVARELLGHLADICETHSDTDFTALLAIGMPRQAPLRFWPLLTDLARRQAVTGVDVCGPEYGHPPSSLRPLADAVHAFNQAQPDLALQFLIHAGEDLRGRSPLGALRWLHQVIELNPHRLGHGLALGLRLADWPGDGEETVRERRAQIAWDLDQAESLSSVGVTIDSAALQREDQDLAQGYPESRLPADRLSATEWHARQELLLTWLRERDIAIECCPTSNRRIAGLTEASHPLRRFLDADVRVVIGSDDPAPLQTDLQTELALASSWSGRPAGAFLTAADDEWRRSRSSPNPDPSPSHG